MVFLFVFTIASLAPIWFHYALALRVVRTCGPRRPGRDQILNREREQHAIAACGWQRILLTRAATLLVHLDGIGRLVCHDGRSRQSVKGVVNRQTASMALPPDREPLGEGG